MQWNDLLDHRSDLQRWLTSSQPDGESRTNWWLGVVLVATWRVESAVASDEALDAEDLGLVLRVIDLATREEAVDPTSRAIRLANLSYLIASVGRVHGVPSELVPDAAVRECLELIQEDSSSVRIDSSRWRSLSRDRMRRLREIKNLITPVTQLMPYVRDGQLAGEANEWTAISSHLP